MLRSCFPTQPLSILETSFPSARCRRERSSAMWSSSQVIVESSLARLETMESLFPTIRTPSDLVSSCHLEQRRLCNLMPALWLVSLLVEAAWTSPCSKCVLTILSVDVAQFPNLVFLFRLAVPTISRRQSATLGLACVVLP